LVISLFKSHPIIDTCVVHESIYTWELIQYRPSGSLALLRPCKLSGDMICLPSCLRNLLDRLNVIGFISSHDDGSRPLTREHIYDPLPYSFGTAGNDDNLIL